MTGVVVNTLHDEMFFDQSALDELAVASERREAMGGINDERAFLECCRAYDSMLKDNRTPSSRTSVDRILSDNGREEYFRLTVELMRATKLNIQELAAMLSLMAEKHRKGRRHTWNSTGSFIESAALWCRYTDFEPEWHMRKRGDTRKLPSSKRQGDDVWGYLRGLYTDPEKARLRMPDGVRRKADRYVGYIDAVEAARAAGQAELKRRHGDDTDLSLVSEVRTAPTKEDELSFFDILMSGVEIV